ncbi:MazG nucleotide pyrophosphohydrolase domain-containing protein [Oceanirhabdus sp. W0125-5]|uniref:MazG nucleotide pyrophosphohydrolase domain-containing protein n=1 Tax=Oceanirhabdus sp. W0125-5 TaxID=2999116 RepID=UPI0022F2FA29|nr:MazG nucleotide pyrophosphohydrolase domain-containing protein [Oceanirhabdus sp. W0125-5]WBW95255.1 MazG nucleotide pyrophosphohydrolase domain-containing protein [Oceanirhabdus sp. W0125-5]
MLVDIKSIIEKQKLFDSMHKGNFNWDEPINESNLNMLQYLIICTLGELGEASNIVKKVVRGDCSLEDVSTDLSEEIIDVFIYVIKLAYQLNIDIESEFLKKLKKNESRFKNYERIE